MGISKKINEKYVFLILTNNLTLFGLLLNKEFLVGWANIPASYLGFALILGYYYVSLFFLVSFFSQSLLFASLFLYSSFSVSLLCSRLFPFTLSLFFFSSLPLYSFLRSLYFLCSHLSSTKLSPFFFSFLSVFSLFTLSYSPFQLCVSLFLMFFPLSTMCLSTPFFLSQVCFSLYYASISFCYSFLFIISPSSLSLPLSLSPYVSLYSFLCFYVSSLSSSSSLFYLFPYFFPSPMVPLSPTFMIT